MGCAREWSLLRVWEAYKMDHRDRLILALSALLASEREARQALEEAISAGALSPALIDAMSRSQSSSLTQDDIVLAEEFSRPYMRSPSRLPS